MVYDSRSLSFAQLGIQSQQFSGRRYLRQLLPLAIPPDFYAASYGQASPPARRGLYRGRCVPRQPRSMSIVNGNIAATHSAP